MPREKKEKETKKGRKKEREEKKDFCDVHEVLYQPKGDYLGRSSNTRSRECNCKVVKTTLSGDSKHAYEGTTQMVECSAKMEPPYIVKYPPKMLVTTIDALGHL